MPFKSIEDKRAYKREYRRTHPEYREKQRVYHREYYRERCRTSPAYCDPESEAYKRRVKRRNERYKNDPEFRLRCQTRSRIRGKERYHQAKNHDDTLKKTCEWKFRVKKQVFNHYSPTLTCQRCGFTNLHALTIDHINGGGKQHRKSIHTNLYIWLRKNGFPEGFQVLCMNCQRKKTKENNEIRLKIDNGARIKARLYKRELRVTTLNHYSPNLKCEKCSQDDLDVLSIDHINGGGCNHFREIGSGDIYGWLKRNNYPEGFQVLCMNCNWIKRVENKEASGRPKRSQHNS